MTSGKDHPTPQGSKKSYSAPAAACAAEVLKTLAAEGRALTLAELERATQRNKSLIFRCLRELEGRQFVSRVNDHRYRLGLLAFEVGVAFLSQDDADDSIRATLRDLADQTGESTNLGVLRGGDVLYLMKYEGRGSFVTLSRVGGRVSATCTAIGKALLATLTAEELHTVIREPLIRMTPASILTLKDLEIELEKTRTRGYSTDLGEAVPGRGGLAVVIPFIGHGVEYAAISLSTELDKLQHGRDNQLLESLLDAQARITREVNSRRALMGER